MTLGVLADQERQLQIWQVLQQAFVPKRCALGARRLVAAIVAGAGIAEPHGEDGDFCFIVETRGLEPQPLAQSTYSMLNLAGPLLCTVPGRLRAIATAPGLRGHSSPMTRMTPAGVRGSRRRRRGKVNCGKYPGWTVSESGVSCR